MDDHREPQFGRQIKLGDEKLDLGLLVPEFAVIIQAYLPYRHNSGEPDALFYDLNPVFAGVLHLRRGYANGMVNSRGGFEIFVNLHKVNEAVAN
jgi:hypothetical protein